MDSQYFSRNGEILPIEQAAVPLANIEYSYGFGVYETIRLSDGVLFFLKEHAERLMESARAIGLEHPFTAEFVEASARELAQKSGGGTANFKVLLLGAPTREAATLSILRLAPLFPDKKLYRDGAAFITREYERQFPQAKTLNMLGSYLALRDAKRASAYDALLVNRQGFITEGTRTNFLCIKDRAISSPRENDILPGIMRAAVLNVARTNGFGVVEQDIAPNDLGQFDGAFVTSSSSKIIPVRSVDGRDLGAPPEALKELMRLFDDFLAHCNGVL